MNRRDLQLLATIRAREARVLLDNDCYDGAYYLIGYAVECGLKACIAKMTRRYDFPDKRAVLESYVHDLDKLVRAAGLEGHLALEFQRDPRFQLNWRIANQWNEGSRYNTSSKAQAEGLYRAVSERRHGVLRWVRLFW